MKSLQMKPSTKHTNPCARKVGRG